MKYLVDANILSEGSKPRPNPSVVGWIRDNEDEIVVDPIIVGELRYGILILPQGKRRQRLEAWFEGGVQQVHCLSWDPECGRRWAQLLADLRASGLSMPVKDSLIATTALVHGLTVVTRNRSDFEKTGVEIFDPFNEPP